MAGKPKDDISSSKDDYWRTKEERDEFDKAIKDLKAQLASKDKELMKEKVESTRLLNQLAQYISPEAYAKMRDEKDKELARLLKVNSELGSINAQQEKRIKELEATTGCRMYFKNKCNAGEAYGAESKKLKKENAALTAKVKKLEKQVEELEAKLANPFGLDAIRELEWKIAKAKAIVKEAGHDNVDDSPSCELCRIWKALEGD